MVDVLLPGIISSYYFLIIEIKCFFRLSECLDIVLIRINDSKVYQQIYSLHTHTLVKMLVSSTNWYSSCLKMYLHRLISHLCSLDCGKRMNSNRMLLKERYHKIMLPWIWVWKQIYFILYIDNFLLSWRKLPKSLWEHICSQSDFRIKYCGCPLIKQILSNTRKYDSGHWYQLMSLQS